MSTINGVTGYESARRRRKKKPIRTACDRQAVPEKPKHKTRVIVITAIGMTIVATVIIVPHVVERLEFLLATGYYGHHFITLFKGR